MPIQENTYILETPEPFRFEESLMFLGRSDLEILHTVNGAVVTKLLPLSKGHVVCQIESEGDQLKLTFPHASPEVEMLKEAGAYIEEWLGLKQDITGFYAMAEDDDFLRPLAKAYEGLRIVGIPDLFEALVWAILGQQINLKFAYTLKKRLIEKYGERQTFDGQDYWIFPTPERLATVSIDELTELQLTRRKVEYIHGVATLMANGELTKAGLQKLNDETIKKELLKIRGIGPWTAEYVMMRCLRRLTSFPIGDAGVHQAVTRLLGLDRKPTVAELQALVDRWTGWESYATYYLWRSLYDKK